MMVLRKCIHVMIVTWNFLLNLTQVFTIKMFIKASTTIATYVTRSLRKKEVYDFTRILCMEICQRIGNVSFAKPPSTQRLFCSNTSVCEKKLK